eukprot:g8681.t1
MGLRGFLVNYLANGAMPRGFATEPALRFDVSFRGVSTDYKHIRERASPDDVPGLSRPQTSSFSIWLLQKTALIVTISPLDRDVEETVSTLEFGSRAMRVQNRPKIHQITDYRSLAMRLQMELDRKEDELSKLLVKVARREGSKGTSSAGARVTTPVSGGGAGGSGSGASGSPLNPTVEVSAAGENNQLAVVPAAAGQSNGACCAAALQKVEAEFARYLEEFEQQAAETDSELLKLRTQVRDLSDREQHVRRGFDDAERKNAELEAQVNEREDVLLKISALAGNDADESVNSAASASFRFSDLVDSRGDDFRALVEKIQRLSEFRKTADGEIETLARREKLAQKKLQDLQRRGISVLGTAQQRENLVDCGVNTSFELTGLDGVDDLTPMRFNLAASKFGASGPNNRYGTQSIQNRGSISESSIGLGNQANAGDGDLVKLKQENADLRLSLSESAGKFKSQERDLKHEVAALQAELADWKQQSEASTSRLKARVEEGQQEILKLQEECERHESEKVNALALSRKLDSDLNAAETMRLELQKQLEADRVRYEEMGKALSDKCHSEAEERCLVAERKVAEKQSAMQVYERNIQKQLQDLEQSYEVRHQEYERRAARERSQLLEEKNKMEAECSKRMEELRKAFQTEREGQEQEQVENWLREEKRLREELQLGYDAKLERVEAEHRSELESVLQQRLGEQGKHWQSELALAAERSADELAKAKKRFYETELPDRLKSERTLLRQQFDAEKKKLEAETSEKARLQNEECLQLELQRCGREWEEKVRLVRKEMEVEGENKLRLREAEFAEKLDKESLEKVSVTKNECETRLRKAGEAHVLELERLRGVLYEEKEAAIASLKEEYAGREAKLRASVLMPLQEEQSRLQEQLQEAQAALRREKERLAELEAGLRAEKQEALAEAGNVRREKELLEELAETLKSRERVLTEEKEKAVLELQGATASLANAREELADAENALQEARTDADTARQEQRSSQEELRKSHEMEVSSTVQELQQRIAELETELADQALVQEELENDLQSCSQKQKLVLDALNSGRGGNSRSSASSQSPGDRSASTDSLEDEDSAERRSFEETREKTLDDAAAELRRLRGVEEQVLPTVEDQLREAEQRLADSEGVVAELQELQLVQLDRIQALSASVDNKDREALGYLEVSTLKESEIEDKVRELEALRESHEAEVRGLAEKAARDCEKAVEAARREAREEERNCAAARVREKLRAGLLGEIFVQDESVAGGEAALFPDGEALDDVVLEEERASTLDTVLDAFFSKLKQHRERAESTRESSSALEFEHQLADARAAVRAEKDAERNTVVTNLRLELAKKEKDALQKAVDERDDYWQGELKTLRSDMEELGKLDKEAAGAELATLREKHLVELEEARAEVGRVQEVLATAEEKNAAAAREREAYFEEKLSAVRREYEEKANGSEAAAKVNFEAALEAERAALEENFADRLAGKLLEQERTLRGGAFAEETAAALAAKTAELEQAQKEQMEKLRGEFGDERRQLEADWQRRVEEETSCVRLALRAELQNETEEILRREIDHEREVLRLEQSDQVADVRRQLEDVKQKLECDILQLRETHATELAAAAESAEALQGERAKALDELAKSLGENEELVSKLVAQEERATQLRRDLEAAEQTAGREQQNTAIAEKEQKRLEAEVLPQLQAELDTLREKYSLELRQKKQERVDSQARIDEAQDKIDVVENLLSAEKERGRGLEEKIEKMRSDGVALREQSEKDEVALLQIKTELLQVQSEKQAELEKEAARDRAENQKVQQQLEQELRAKEAALATARGELEFRQEEADRLVQKLENENAELLRKSSRAFSEQREALLEREQKYDELIGEKAALIDELQGRVNEKDAEVQQTTAELLDLASREEESRTQVGEKLVVLEDRVSELEAELEKRETALQRQRQLHERSSAELLQEKTLLVNERENRVAILEAELAAQKRVDESQLERLQTGLEDALERIVALQQREAALEADQMRKLEALDKTATEVQSLKRETDLLERENASLRSEVLVLKNYNQDLASERLNAEKRCTERSLDTLNRSEAEVLLLREQRDTLQAKLERAELARESAERSRQLLETGKDAELAALRTELNCVRTSLQEARDGQSKKEQLLWEYRKRLKKSASALDEITERNRSEVEKMQGENSKENSDWRRKLAEVGDLLEREREKFDSERAALEERVKGVEEEKAAEVGAAEQRLAAKQQQADELQASLRQVQSERSALDKELARAKARIRTDSILKDRLESVSPERLHPKERYSNLGAPPAAHHDGVGDDDSAPFSFLAAGSSGSTVSASKHRAKEIGEEEFDKENVGSSSHNILVDDPPLQLADLVAKAVRSRSRNGNKRTGTTSLEEELSKMGNLDAAEVEKALQGTLTAIDKNWENSFAQGEESCPPKSAYELEKAVKRLKMALRK